MKNNTQMFKAFKLLNKEKHNNFFVHGKDDISATKPQEIYKITGERFKKYFQKKRIPAGHISEPESLKQEITGKDVKEESLKCPIIKCQVKTT